MNLARDHTTTQFKEIIYIAHLGGVLPAEHDVPVVQLNVGVGLRVQDSLCSTQTKFKIGAITIYTFYRPQHFLKPAAIYLHYINHPYKKFIFVPKDQLTS